MRQKWLIRLGEQEWQRFTHLQAGPGLELIGSVNRGPQMGALARLDGDRYVQINGDFISALSQAQIRRALALVHTAPPRPGRWWPSRRPTDASMAPVPQALNRVAANQPAPVVIIRRRRRISF